MAQTATETLGIVSFLMMQSEQHRGLTLEALTRRCLPAINAGLVVTAQTPPQPKDDRTVPNAPLAYAIFARVSDAWDEKLRDPEFDLGTLPREAWNSGPHQWLVDLLAAKDGAGPFAARAAAALFEEGSTLNIRLLDDAGTMKIGERTVGR